MRAAPFRSWSPASSIATERPDGSTYHITWSLGPGREARESNDVLREKGWQALAEAIPLRLAPRIFDAG